MFTTFTAVEGGGASLRRSLCLSRATSKCSWKTIKLWKLYKVREIQLQLLSSLDTLKIRSVLSNPASVLKPDLELSRNFVGG